MRYLFAFVNDQVKKIILLLFEGFLGFAFKFIHVFLVAYKTA